MGNIVALHRKYTRVLTFQSLCRGCSRTLAQKFGWTQGSLMSCTRPSCVSRCSVRGREAMPGDEISQSTLYIVTLCSKRARALTFENFWKHFCPVLAQAIPVVGGAGRQGRSFQGRHVAYSARARRHCCTEAFFSAVPVFFSVGTCCAP
jgi:predicted Fe-S protein YdhL (DUF1289 family)